MKVLRFQRLAATSCFTWLLAASACGGRDELDLPPLEAGGSAGLAGSSGKGGSAGAPTGGSNSGGFGGFVSGGFGGFITGGFGGSIVTGGAGGFTGGAGGFTGGSAGTAGTGGFSGGENCTNTIDDDADGAIDCEDFDCSAYMCAPLAPLGGWNGPVAFWEGMSAALEPSCAGSGYPNPAVSATSGLTVEPIECAECICSSPQGIVCPTARMRFFSSSDCSVSGGNTRGITADECHPFVFSGADPTGLEWSSAPPVGGACLPDTDGPAFVPPLEWDQFAVACGGSGMGAGCDSGACVPAPQAPFESGLCVYRSGDIACPAGPYSIREVFYRGAADSRRCTDCGCADPGGASCTGTFYAGTDRDCSADVVSMNSPGECVALPPDPTLPPQVGFLSSRSFLYQSDGPVGGSCQASGGVGTGTATVADPVTFCCL